jgi:hypothetical protein
MGRVLESASAGWSWPLWSESYGSALAVMIRW